MIEVPRFTLPEVIPQSELQQWRAGLEPVDKTCPEDVRDFIDALADKLSDFGQIGKETQYITGYELQLAGCREMAGEMIIGSCVYPIKVPKMVACDHRRAMHLTYTKKGRQGLIDFCKIKVKGTELERLLDVLNVHVFKEKSEKLEKMLAEIKTSGKLEMTFTHD